MEVSGIYSPVALSAMEELTHFSGHNPILTYTPVLTAVMRSFGLPDEAGQTVG
jgi:hypothetical protein